MYCKNCGAEIPEGVAFCPNCGAQSQGDTTKGKTTLTHILGRAVIAVLAIVFILSGISGVISSRGSRTNYDPTPFYGIWQAEVQKDGGLTTQYFVLTIANNGGWDLYVTQRGNVLGTNYGELEQQGTWQVVAKDTIRATRTDVADSFYDFKLSADGTSLKNEDLVFVYQGPIS